MVNKDLSVFYILSAYAHLVKWICEFTRVDLYQIIYYI